MNQTLMGRFTTGLCNQPLSSKPSWLVEMALQEIYPIVCCNLLALLTDVNQQMLCCNSDNRKPLLNMKEHQMN